MVEEQREQTHPRVIDAINQYKALQDEIEKGESKRISLTQELDFKNWRETFKPNPNRVEAEINTEMWAKYYGIWLEKYSHDTATMGAYLHPETKNQLRLELINQVYLILFYIDDKYSNDISRWLPGSEVNEGIAVIAGLLKLLKQFSSMDLDEIPDPKSDFSVVQATWNTLSQIKKESASDGPLGKKWFGTFIGSMTGHLSHATESQNNKKFDPEEFIDMRNDISGMWITTAFKEFGPAKYLDHENLPEDVSQTCQLIKLKATRLGGFTNELHSLEKEVFLNEDQFNMIAQWMINDPNLTLIEAIYECIRFVNKDCDDLYKALQKLQALLPTIQDPEQHDAVKSYMRQAVSVAVASLTWEVDTDRYQVDDQYAEPKRGLKKVGIFTETDPFERKRLRLAGILKSGKQLPVDYDDIQKNVYGAAA